MLFRRFSFNEEDTIIRHAPTSKVNAHVARLGTNLGGTAVLPGVVDESGEGFLKVRASGFRLVSIIAPPENLSEACGGGGEWGS